MNRVILKGRLGGDPETRTTGGGKTVVNFSVATDRFGGKDGQKPPPDWHRCQAWDKTAEFVQKYFTKGQEILVEGRIQYGQYDGKDGKPVYTTDIIVDRAEFCGSKKESGQGQATADASGTKETTGETTTVEVPF